MAGAFEKSNSARSNFVTWSEGAKLDILDIPHKGALSRLSDLFTAQSSFALGSRGELLGKTGTKPNLNVTPQFDPIVLHLLVVVLHLFQPVA